MKRMFAAAGSVFARLIADESGGEPAEYVVVTGGVVALSYPVVKSVGERVLALWHSLDTALVAAGA